MNKKVLIMSCNCLSKTSNNGKTLFNFFKDWDQRLLSQFYTYNELPDFPNRYSFFRITDSDMIRFRFHCQKTCGQSITTYDLFPKSAPIKKHMFENFSRMVRDFIWKRNNWYNCGVLDWIDQNKPDFIFFLGLNNPYLYSFCSFLQKRLNIPVMVYLTDDYLHSRFSLSPFYWFRLFGLRKCFKKLLTGRTGLITVNYVMKQEYERLFNRKCFLLTNYINSPFSEYSLSNNPIKKIVYIGNLLHGRWRNIINFSKMIDGQPFVLEVYPGKAITASVKKKLEKRNNIRVGDFLDSDGVIETIIESDYVLHVESFSYSDICLARYSLSTKITEYAAYCRPIIAFCPRQVASFKILKENNLAICIDKRINKTFLHLMNDANYLKTIVKNAYRFFDDERKQNDMEHLIANLYHDLVNYEKI